MLRYQFLDKARKTIVRRLEKILKICNQPDVVIVIEKTIMQGTNQDPIILVSIKFSTPQYNVDNVGQAVQYVENYKQRMCKMKRNLVKERGKGG